MNRKRINSKKMKTFIATLILGLGFPLMAYSQEGQTTLTTDQEKEAQPVATALPQAYSKDSLTVPLAAPIPANRLTPEFGMYGISPFDYGFATWELHKGLNASVGLNVTFSPSRYAPSGVGFGQDAAFMYAVPVSKRVSIAGGLYASHMDWGFLSYKDVGIAGVAAFKVNERISIYAYGNKSLMPQRMPYYYPLPYFSTDKLGGMVNFKLGESASISIGVEGRRYSY